MKRRDFLQLLGLAGAAAALPAVLPAEELPAESLSVGSVFEEATPVLLCDLNKLMDVKAFTVKHQFQQFGSFRLDEYVGQRYSSSKITLCGTIKRPGFEKVHELFYGSRPAEFKLRIRYQNQEFEYEFNAWLAEVEVSTLADLGYMERQNCKLVLYTTAMPKANERRW